MREVMEIFSKEPSTQGLAAHLVGVFDERFLAKLFLPFTEDGKVVEA